MRMHTQSSYSFAPSDEQLSDVEFFDYFAVTVRRFLSAVRDLMT
jgi:hypothetical protein